MTFSICHAAPTDGDSEVGPEFARPEEIAPVAHGSIVHRTTRSCCPSCSVGTHDLPRQGRYLTDRLTIPLLCLGSHRRYRRFWLSERDSVSPSQVSYRHDAVGMTFTRREARCPPNSGPRERARLCPMRCHRQPADVPTSHHNAPAPTPICRRRRIRPSDSVRDRPRTTHRQPPAPNDPRPSPQSPKSVTGNTSRALTKPLWLSRGSAWVFGRVGVARPGDGSGRWV